MNTFPYPLPAEALQEYCGMGELARPVEQWPEVIAANGLICLRVSLGRWLRGEHAVASDEVRRRVDKLPWGRLARKIEAGDWHPMDEVRAAARQRGQIAMRHAVTGRIAPSPVWKVGPVAVRLSVLMAAAKLPRVEMAWDDDRESPIFLRFSGGRGIIAYDRNLSGTVPARALHQGKRDALRPGATLDRPIRSTGNLAKPPPPEPMLDDWPPADFS